MWSAMRRCEPGCWVPAGWTEKTKLSSDRVVSHSAASASLTVRYLARIARVRSSTAARRTLLRVFGALISLGPLRR
jgi:hypothetical protein